MFQNDFIQKGKVSVLIGGQFGSEGKGVVAGYIASICRGQYEYAVTNASANAGHTCTMRGEKIVLNHLPLTGLYDDRCWMHLSAGAIVDPPALLKEIERVDHYNVTHRISIHPRAGVITQEHQIHEARADSPATKIGSTQHGVGEALVAKIRRSAQLAGDDPRLALYAHEVPLNTLLESGLSVVMEIPQGHGLGINSGYKYPYCTSREVSIAQSLADAQIHPSFLGPVAMVVRTYPIRVGNITDPSGAEIGNSGPFWPDSKEITFEEIGVQPEITTVTKRIRRVATFSKNQYVRALHHIRPDYVFLSFCDYPGHEEVIDQMVEAGRPPDFLGFGPNVEDISAWGWR